MEIKFAPSVNIVRDESLEINYTVTPNSSKVATQIADLYKAGFHCFTIIGSYGSGKSSFLWAYERALTGKDNFFENSFSKFNSIDFIKIVGEPSSFRDQLAQKLGLLGKKVTSKQVIEAFGKNLGKSHFTILIVDEFGKFLEEAVRKNAIEEIYFLQELAEFINSPKQNCIWITTLHQSFEAYGHHELSDGDKNEWKKVNGRFKDLTFNEPIEQLLLLAANNIESNNSTQETRASHVTKLQSRFHVIKSEDEFVKEVADKLWPLDIISAYLLCVALQRYGQNERSLFTFLESEKNSIHGNQIGVSEIHDYLFHEFYSYLSSKYNIDYSGWSMINYALSRVDTEFEKNKDIAEDVIKLIGLISLFGHKGAHIEKEFVKAYLSYLHDSTEVAETIESLERHKIIRFNRFNKSYKIWEGTDLNFEDEFLRVSQDIEEGFDLESRLNEYFSFSAVNAKAISYRIGTPRFFKYIVSESPIEELPKEQIDGFINLLFDDNDPETIVKTSREFAETLYAHFTRTREIRQTVYDLEKTQRVIATNKEDKVAVKELETILKSQQSLLNHQVVDALFSKDVTWYHAGQKINIQSKKELNRKLSDVCEEVYFQCPTFRNELINKHFVSGNIANSKKILFQAVVGNHDLEDLGFPSNKFPAEKTIYLTLLKSTGIHRKQGKGYTYEAPLNQEFQILWQACDSFLESARSERRKVSELFDLLLKKPFKLTPGFLEFWVPIYLFVKRDDYALYSKTEGYIPEVNDSILYMFTRVAQDYEIKAFDVNGIKLDLYNKYREFLTLTDVEKVDNTSLIESIKPFLIFHKDLNEYAKNTKRLSKSTLEFRKTIETVQDPESLFFDHFPRAFDTDIEELLSSKKVFEEYIDHLRSSIKELRSCYDELVGRFETFLVEEVLGLENLGFGTYKEKLVSRYDNLKEHMLLKEQVSFLMRLRMPLDDRNSWINSLCQVVTGKRLEALKDKEEEILKEKLRFIFRELDNLVSISDEADTLIDQEILKVELTSFDKGLLNETIIVPKEVHEETQQKLDEIDKILGENRKMNLYLLVNLLKKKLDE